MDTRTERSSQSGPPASATPVDREICIRMYDVGFGDCFLLLLPGRGRVQRILIDCGSFKAGKNKLKDVVGHIIREVTDADQVPRIDLLVATHRHKDHIIGFDDPRWDEVEVGEVWMPWTESDEPEAKNLAAAQNALALALERFAAASGRDLAEPHDVLMLNAGSNDGAMDTLRRGFASVAKRRYLPEKDASDKVVPCDSLSGVRIRVLGPSRDPSTILNMDPPRGEGFFTLLGLRAAIAAAPDGPSLAPQPFGVDWVDDNPPIELDSRAIDRLDAVHDDLAVGLASALDRAINNTSLVLLISVGDTHLLFPGDAQWGTWREMLGDSEVCRLLARCSFYKVGHHASHNATPISFVEEYLGREVDKVWAMVPVVSYSKWPEIPRQPLLDALKAKTSHIVRSDDPRASPGFRWEGDLYVEACIPIT